MGIKNMLGGRAEEDSTYEPKTEHSNSYHEVKRKIHGRLVEEANLAALDTLEPSEIRMRLRMLSSIICVRRRLSSMKMSANILSMRSSTN